MGNCSFLHLTAFLPRNGASSLYKAHSMPTIGKGHINLTSFTNNIMQSHVSSLSGSKCFQYKNDIFCSHATSREGMFVFPLCIQCIGLWHGLNRKLLHNCVIPIWCTFKYWKILTELSCKKCFTCYFILACKIPLPFLTFGILRFL